MSEDTQKIVSASLLLEQARRQLHEFEERQQRQQQQLQILEDIIEQNDVMAIVWRMEADKWPVEYISGNTEWILGYTPEDFLSGRVSWSGITYPADNSRLEREIEEHVKKGDRKWAQEYRLVAKSGEILWFRDINRLISDPADGAVKIQAVLYDITERRKIGDERRLISQRIALTREEEKKRLSTALHDAIGVMVVSLSSSLVIAQEEIKHGGKSSAAAELNRAMGLLKEVAAIMKQICVDIRPPVLEIAGLSGALSELISRLKRRSKISIVSKINLPDAVGSLGSHLDMVVYRLVHEALFNAIKYSKAKNIKLNVKQDCDNVTLTISDDGCGFNMTKVKSKKECFGLKIMREEAQGVGGDILIDSELGRGTVIKAKFPYRHTDVV